MVNLTWGTKLQKVTPHIDPTTEDERRCERCQDDCAPPPELYPNRTGMDEFLYHFPTYRDGI